MFTQGNVTQATKTLWTALTWKVISPGPYGQFNQAANGKIVVSRPFIGGNGAWGANFVGFGGVLTITEATKNAVANCTFNPDGSFVDVTNALGNGSSAAYTLQGDSVTSHCVAVPV